MTNSTDNNQTPSPAKKKKAKGPIRWEAIVPFFIVVALVGAYFILFFDTHLRKGLEFAGTYINGAEVNIGNLRTSFTQGSLLIENIEVTKIEEPAKNSVQIGRIHFKFLWDALLRAKFVIDDASINELQVNTPRKRPGKVTKKDDPDLSEEKEEAKGNALADAGKLLGGALNLDQLQNIGNLKSAERIAGLQTELSKKQEEWNNALKTLPTPQDLSALQKRIQNVRIGGTNNPLEIQKQIQEIDALVKDTTEKVNRVKAQGEAIQNSVTAFTNSFKEIDELVKKDIKDLESKLQLPKLDVSSLSTQLFGEKFLSKVSQVKRYMAMAQKYLPPRNTKEEREALRKEIEPPKRGEGKTFQFPKERGYPLFWLRHASLSSKAQNSPFGGNIEGTLKDICTKPDQIGKPAVATFKGDFPGQELFDVDFEAVFDHTGPEAKQTVKASIGSFAVAQQMLSDTDSLKLGFTKAKGGTSLFAKHEKGVITINSQTAFQNIDYIVSAQQQQLQEILKGAVSDVARITVDANATGSFSDMKMDIRSNLASELEKGFQKQLQAKLSEARNKIQALIDEKIGTQRKQLDAQTKAAQSQVQSEVKKRQEEVENIKKQAEAKLNEAKNQAQNQGQKALDDLKNKFKF